jgi:hypothetical protein
MVPHLTPVGFKEGRAVTVELPLDERSTLASYGLQRKANGLIGWHPDSKDHPRNWSLGRKAFDTTVVVLLEFYT